MKKVLAFIATVIGIGTVGVIIKNRKNKDQSFQLPFITLQWVQDVMKMKLRWYGTAALGISSEQTKLLFDPFVPLKGSKCPTRLMDYAEYPVILVTHGHLDHIVDIPRIVSNRDTHIYCTRAPYTTLKRKHVPEYKLKLVDDDFYMSFADIKIQTFKTRHIKFDSKLIRSKLNMHLLTHLGNAFFCMIENYFCKEEGEIIAYYLQADKNVFVMGSLGLEHVEYPKDIDVLILPFQGASNLEEQGLAVVSKLLPKKIILDHFDDTFPPISDDVKTDGFMKLMQEQYPDIEVIIPNYEEEIEL